MNTIILVIIVLIIVSVAIAAFLLLKCRSRKRQVSTQRESKIDIDRRIGEEKLERLRKILEEELEQRSRKRQVSTQRESKIDIDRRILEEELEQRSRERPVSSWIHLESGSIGREIEIESCTHKSYVILKEDTEREVDAERQEQERERKEAELAAKRESFKQKYKISVAHPRLLSKGYASLFVVQIYLPSLRLQAKRVIMKDLPIKKVTEHLRDIELEKGLKVKIKLSSPVLLFSDPVTKQIENGLTTTYFTAIPSDNCRSGSHSVVLSVVDIETQVEYLSTSLNVRVVDFAFDHVSRPFLSKAMSAVLGLGSLTMFVLTALEQVDKTFGLTAGTAAAVLTSTILVQWWSIFHHPAVTHTP